MKTISSLILVGSLVFGIAKFQASGTHENNQTPKAKKDIPAPSNCSASPYSLQIDQADGTSINIIGKGNMNNSWTETTDGYSIVSVNGIYEYATKVNGSLQGTGVKANDPQNRLAQETAYLSGIQKSIQPDLDPLKNSILSQVNAHLNNKTYPTTGNIRVLALLIDYPDLNNTYPKSNFDSLLYGANYRSGDGSFKTYYETSSNGMITVDVDVVGWYRAANNYRYYSRDSGYDRAADLVREAVDAAEAAGINYANYDNDNDGDVDGILTVHAGPGAESGGLTQYIWSHRWVLNGGNLGAVTYDGKFINDYMLNPETRGSISNPRMVGIGVFCHEFGHNLGLPDLYDTDDNNGGSEGIGNWCLMAGGGWLGGEHRPINFSAWCRIENGWDTPTSLTIGGSSSHSLSPASTTQNEIIRVNTGVASEYFLLENRQQTGLDLELPGTGLAVWHINTTKTNSSGNSVNADENLKGVDLEEADGNNDLDNEVNRGDAGDLFPGSTNNTTFDDNSNPNARNYSLATTGLELRNITEAGSQLNFDFGPFVAASCSGGTTNLTASTGTFTDGSAPSANYTNNLNCSWLIQPTNAASVILNFSRFDVDNTIDRVAIYDGIDFSAPLIGTYTGNILPSTITSTGGNMYIEFTTNGTNTGLGWEATYTSTTASTSCSGATTTLTSSAGTFNDGSGASNYGNNLNCSWLIQPPGVSSITLGFTSLATEIGNDVIRIYDGANNSAPLIASYSGTNNLNTTTSSGGSMFVEFITNGSVTDAGWDAVYSSSTSGPGCSGSTTLTASSGSFSDGSGANDYDNNQFCSWLIQPPSGTINLSFTAFSTENNNDRVLVFDGVDNNAPQIGNFSGSSIPPNLTSSSNSLYLEFRTNGAIVDAGWDASYTTNVSTTTCSGTTNITNTSGNFNDGSGPNVDYSNNLDCNWLIDITTASIIQLRFDSMDVATGDTVFIYDGNSSSSNLLGSYTGSNIPPILSTTGNTAYVNFKTNGSSTSKGWQISYDGVNGCSGSTTFTASAGTFSDGTSPTQQYVNNLNCEWLIQPPGANFILLDFNRFRTESNFDFVDVFDGATTGSPLLGRFDGANIPPSIASSGGSLLVRFTSDGSQTDLGWEARYSSTTSTCLQNRLLTANTGNLSDGSGTANYDNNSNCSWLIQPTLALSITLTFNSFDTQSTNDVVNVYDGTNNSGTLIGSYSGNSIPAAITVNGTNKSLFVEFLTDGSVTAAGWDATYTSTSAITCSGVTNLSTPSGSFSDGSGTGIYDNNLNCGWLIQPTGNPASITFTMNNIALANFGDRVRVYDGTNNLGSPIGFYNGSNTGNPVTAYSGSMFVEFVTDASGQGQGWDASYTSSSTYCSPLTTFTSDFGNFTDGSPFGGNYLDNTDCQWLIQPTTPNIAVRLSFFQFDTEALNDTVTIYDGTTTNAPILGTYSGNLTSIPAITSSGGSMLVTFKSNGSTTATGWRASYGTQTIPSCSGLTTLTAATGTFDDGSSATSNYIENSNCQWLIQPTGASIVSLSFNRFETEANFDYVRVYDGANNTSPLIGTYSGNSIPSTINSTGGSLFVEFISNGLQNFLGWEATYNSSTSQCFNNLSLTAFSDTISDGSQNLNYQNNLNCSWIIQPPTALSVTLDFLDFDLDNLGDTLKIYDGTSSSAPLLAALTGNSLPPAITSTGGNMYIEFITDATLTAQGWRGVYTITSNLTCFGTTNLTAPSGTFDDGSGVFLYDNNLGCNWLIQPAGNPAVIVLSMTSMNLANFGDRVQVYDGVDNNGTLLATYFGSNTGVPVSAYSGSMFVQFTTDGSQQGQGWDASYSSSNSYCAPNTTYTANFGNFTDGSPTGQDYLPNTSCQWLIQPTATNVAISLTLFQFDTELNFDSVTVYDGATTAAPILGSFSGNLGTLPAILSSGGDMLVTFESDNFTNASGWRANYSTQPIPACSGLTTFTSSSGTFDDGSGNGTNYTSNSNCQWLIQPTGGAINIDLSFNYFVTQANFDLVNVYDGTTNSAPSLGSFSGNSIPPMVTATSGSMLVEFISNGGFNLNGFEATYTSSNNVNLTASPDTVYINAGAGSTANFSVNSNTTWQTSDDATWLIGSPFNGSGNQTVNLLAIQPNIGPERTAMAFVSATQTNNKDTVIVIQRASGNFLVVDPDTLYFSDNPSSSQLATINSSVTWNALANLSWITVGTTSGSNNGSSAISVSQNSSTMERIGYVVFSGNLGVANDTVFIKQDGRIVQPPSLSVTPSNITLAETSGSSDIFTVNSTVTWQTSSPASWIAITNPTSTMDTNTVLIATTSDNLSQSNRSSFVAVQDIGGTLFDTVFVTQLGSPATLNVNPDTVFLNAANGSVGTTTLSTNVTWTGTPGDTWFTGSPLSGMSSVNTVPVTVTANSANTNTTDRISFIAYDGGGLKDTLVIVQRGSTPAPPSMSVSPKFISLAQLANSLDTFTINSTVTWQANSPASWLNVNSPVNNFDTNKVEVVANSANTSPTIRSTFVAVQDIGGTLFDTVFVDQLGTTPSLLANPDTVRLAALSGSSGNGNITSNLPWTLTTGATWFGSSSNSGNNNAALTFTANSDNNTGAERVSFAAISDAANTIFDTIFIVQDFIPTGGGLSTNPDTIRLLANAGSSNTFMVNAGSALSWTSTPDASWINLSNLSGTGSQMITVTANTANMSQNERMTFIVTADLSLPMPDTVFVIQEGTQSNFTVSPSTISLNSTSGSSDIVSVNSNVNWTINNPVTWISLSSSSGSNNGSITITANSDNLSGVNRTATLSFDSPGLTSQLVTVTQVDGSIPSFSLSLDTLLLSNPQGSTGTFSVLSNISGWNLSENASWLLINPTFGDNTASITALAASRNSFGTPRTAIIRATAPGFPTDSVVVIQKEATPLFQVAPNMIVLGSDSADAMSFNISSNLTSWTVSENSPWMETSVIDGSFTQRVVVTATDSNNTGNVRTDTITVSSPPLVPQIVSVTQDTIIPIGINDYSLKQSIGIYPNPSYGLVTIQLNNNYNIADARLQVFNMLGKQIEVDLSNINQQSLQIDLSGKASGIYFINLVVGDEKITKKITLLD